MEIQVNVRFRASDTLSYEADVNLPTSEPSAAAPFKFSVVQITKDSTGSKQDSRSKALDVAIGDANHIYVAVMPPQDLLESTGVSKVVENLQVMIQEGSYNPDDGKFADQQNSTADNGQPNSETSTPNDSGSKQ